MQKRRTLLLIAGLALVSLAPPCAAQSVGSPTPQDTLENNLNALRGPSPGAPPRITVPTPQQSLDGNIDSLRPGGAPSDRPTPQYQIPAARAPNHHPGADALLSPTGVKLKPGQTGQRHKRGAARRKAHVR